MLPKKTTDRLNQEQSTQDTERQPSGETPRESGVGLPVQADQMEDEQDASALVVPGEEQQTPTEESAPSHLLNEGDGQEQAESPHADMETPIGDVQPEEQEERRSFQDLIRRLLLDLDRRRQFQPADRAQSDRQEQAESRDETQPEEQDGQRQNEGLIRSILHGQSRELLPGVTTAQPQTGITTPVEENNEGAVMERAEAAETPEFQMLRRILAGEDETPATDASPTFRGRRLPIIVTTAFFRDMRLAIAAMSLTDEQQISLLRLLFQPEYAELFQRFTTALLFVNRLVDGMMLLVIEPEETVAGMTQEEISNIPQVVLNQAMIEEQRTCSICMEDFQLEQSVRQLVCNHRYHADCIASWLGIHRTCPFCRRTL